MGTYWQRPFPRIVDGSGRPTAGARADLLPWEDAPHEAPRSLLQRQAALWAEADLGDGVVLRGWALQAAEAWATRHSAELGEIEREFLQVCRDVERCARRQARALAVLRCALVGIAAAALVILGVAFQAQHQGEGYLRTQEMLRAQLLLAEAQTAAAETQVEAEVAARRLAVAAQQEVARRLQHAEVEARAADARRQRAEARTLAAYTLQLRDDNPRLALLLGLEAVRRATGVGEWGVLVEAREALLAALGQDARRLAVEGVLEPPTDALDIPLATACQRAGRNLTADEWTRYLGPGVPYERTCAMLP